MIAVAPLVFGPAVTAYLATSVHPVPRDVNITIPVPGGRALIPGVEDGGRKIGDRKSEVRLAIKRARPMFLCPSANQRPGSRRIGRVGAAVMDTDSLDFYKSTLDHSSITDQRLCV